MSTVVEDDVVTFTSYDAKFSISIEEPYLFSPEKWKRASQGEIISGGGNSGWVIRTTDDVVTFTFGISGYGNGAECKYTMPKNDFWIPMLECLTQVD